MLACPPLSISFKMYVQSSLSPTLYLPTFSLLVLNINYLFTYIFILSAYLVWLIDYAKLTTKFTL